jgi:hypothetical protein
VVKFAETGAAIEGADWRIDKLIDDGVMALFAVDNSYPEGYRDTPLRVDIGNRW